MALEGFSKLGKLGEVGVGGSTPTGRNPDAGDALDGLAKITTNSLGGKFSSIKMTGQARPNGVTAPVNFRASSQNEKTQFRYGRGDGGVSSIRFEIVRSTESAAPRSAPLLTLTVDTTGYKFISSNAAAATLGPGGFDANTNDYVVNVQILQPDNYTANVYDDTNTVEFGAVGPLLATLKFRSRARGTYGTADRHLNPALAATNVNPEVSFTETRWHSNRRAGKRNFKGLGKGNVTITT